jgi:hypothetical protein
LNERHALLSSFLSMLRDTSSLGRKCPCAFSFREALERLGSTTGTGSLAKALV